MIKTVGIVSLSSGIIGEDSVAHEVVLGVRRLEAMGLTVRFLPHARDGIQALKEHPEHRAADLIEAFRDPSIDMILCATGGDDTYRLLPYLFEHGELQDALSPKPFLGFSDTTVNHLMLHKLGLPTFYGQAFLPDVCTLGPDILPYTGTYFRELIETGAIRQIRPSPVWYEERESYGPEQMGVPLREHPNRGFEHLQGPSVFSGPILGGCLDTLFDLFDPGRYADMPSLCARYGLFPDREDWRGRILLLETSEETPSPAKFRAALEHLKASGVFSEVNGVLVGKPMDEKYSEEYRAILPEVIGDLDLPVVYNLNIGHANPRCILPFGVDAVVDAAAQTITFA